MAAAWSSAAGSAGVLGAAQQVTATVGITGVQGTVFPAGDLLWCRLSLANLNRKTFW